MLSHYVSHQDGLPILSNFGKTMFMGRWRYQIVHTLGPESVLRNRATPPKCLWVIFLNL